MSAGVWYRGWLGVRIARARKILGYAALVLGATDVAAQGTQPAVPVTRIDHIIVITPHANHIRSLLSDTLGLPLVWPQAGALWTRSSGVSLGNANLEIMPAATDTATAFIGSLALQTDSLVQVHRALEARAVPHGEPSHWPRGDTIEKQWTTMGIPGMGIGFLFVQYHKFNLDERRVRFAKLLESAAGGPLGVVGLKEVRVPVSDPDKTRTAWRRVVEFPETLVWRPAFGPAVRLQRLEQGAERTLLIQVKSMRAAAAALSALNIGFSRATDRLVLDRNRFYGLQFELTEHE